MTGVTEYLTKAKFDELTKELDQLRNVRRKEVAEQLEYTKQLGDLSENAEYHQAREEQAFLEDRIAKLDSLLKSATVVANGAHHSVGTVGIGSTIELRRQSKASADAKATVTYILVGSEEANNAGGKLSTSSPLGIAILGKKKGDEIKVKTPGGEVNYSIVKVA
jgi:transcription elongation factor GreA